MAGTDHRIGELRVTRAAALPGRSLCFYDPQYRIIDEVILDENGHAQDRSQFDEVLERVRKGELSHWRCMLWHTEIDDWYRFALGVLYSKEAEQYRD